MTEKWILGFDIGGTHIKAGIVNSDGIVLLHDIIPTEAKIGRERIIANILGLVERYSQHAKNNRIAIEGIGIGTAGQINSDRGIVTGATDNLPGWQGIELSDVITAATGLKAYIDNDVNTIAIGESWIGAGKAWPSFLCIAIGTGLGGCFIWNGKPYYGRDGFAGEFGHQVIALDGIPCTCGNLGCWEQYASVSALMRLANTRASENSLGADMLLSPKKLFENANNGVVPAELIIEQYTNYIAIGLANLIHAFNPPAIIIAGAIAQQGESFIQRIRTKVQSKLLPVFHKVEPTPIFAASLGEMAGVIGAAKLVLNHV